MKISKSLSLPFCFTALMSATALSCTGMQLRAKDGSYVNGRTVEFGIPLQLTAVVIPRHYPCKGTLPNGDTGMVYRSKYAAVGGAMFGASDIADGVNEKGLAVGDFYFQNYASYAPVTAENKSHALSPSQFSNWILTQFATVDEVKQGLKSVAIVATTPPGWPVLPPFHYVVYDKQGKSIVIEPMGGKLVVYDNPTGTMANSPTFDWQLTNLSNYVNLSPFNAPNRSVNGYELKQFGQGSGLHGLPGNFSSPSRFVRSAFFASLATPVDNAASAVFQAFHLLNQFDIPVGSVRQQNLNSVTEDRTIMTTVKDPVNLKYYFRSYEDQNVKVVDLKGFDWNGKTIKKISMGGVQSVTDVTNTAQNF